MVEKKKKTKKKSTKKKSYKVDPDVFKDKDAIEERLIDTLAKNSAELHAIKKAGLPTKLRPHQLVSKVIELEERIQKLEAIISK